ncbi:MAG: undecaprenyl-diphosphate phosphatase [Lentisphaerae bacterium]|nr:undecaprenyl-diphosphate phosphatase [Lentisphaerota bacterium]
MIQGLTEFLPISSSGHLVLAKHFLNLKAPGAILETVLHAGTLISVILYYRKRLISLIIGFFRKDEASIRYSSAILFASLPALIAYMTLGEYIEAAFNMPQFVAVMLLVTGLIALSTAVSTQTIRSMNRPIAVLIGCAQAFAMIPGISRSGATIAVGKRMGISSNQAAEFSFIMSIPALMGAVAIKLFDLPTITGTDLTPLSLVFGLFVAACVGYFAIRFLIRTLEANKFWIFGVYCLIIGVIAMGLTYIKEL